MSDAQTRRFVEECQDMTEVQIIAAYHADYHDKSKPHVRTAFEQMGIAEHEVSAWVYKNVK